MNKVYVVSELGINHNGNLDVAKQMIDVSVACGADAVKMQVYDTDRLYNFNKYAKSYWDSKQAELSHKDFEVLADYSTINWFASPFDVDAVNLLEKIGVDRYKVASRSVIDHTLLKEIAKTKKPVYMSTGKHPIDTIKSAMEILKDNKVTLLYCVPDYPAKVKDLNFGRMIKLADIFKTPCGFSDHTTGMWASLEAVRLGATVIEKHFTMNRLLPGCDQICSIEPPELKLLVKSIRQYEAYTKEQTL